MSTKLNQVLAAQKGIKARSLERITAAHHSLQKSAILSGISRSYTPKDDEGDKLPSEFTKIQLDAETVIKETSESLAELFDVTWTVEKGNTSAKSDVVVDGHTILKEVPVTYLLFLEKQLVDLHTFIKKLPVLDAAENWHRDENQGCFSTDPIETIRSKKVYRNHVKAAATQQHPAQVDVYTEDVPVGTWKTIKFSGSLPQTRVTELLTRVEKLQTAVKFARESANNLDVTPEKVGESFFKFLFK